MTNPAHQTLHKLLRCVHTGLVERTPLPNGQWIIHINDQRVTNADRLDEFRLGLSILAQEGLIRWVTTHKTTQSAGRTVAGRLMLKQWDHEDLFEGEPTPLDVEQVNDAVWDDPDGDAA